MHSTTCTNCGEQLEPDWDTCPACTTAVGTSNKCGSCNRELKPNWKICPYCKTPHASSSAFSSAGSESFSANPLMTPMSGAQPKGMSYQPELPPGTELLHYRIEALLGRGASSTVYRAYNTQLQEELALKVVASFEKEHPLLQAYKEEYTAQRAIPDKSHILHCEAPFVHRHTDDMTWLMLPMELAHESLRDWMKRHPVGNQKRLEQGMEFFRQACKGVEAIHKKGLVHLDIKPENILLTGDAENPVVKVADFGIARSMSQAGQRSELYADGIGTPAYMAPEQILAARWKDVGKEADIYALGMIIYELLDGDLPYSGSAKAIKEKKRDASIEISPPEGSPYLAEVVTACLSRDKKKRPVSATALITQLDEKRKQEHQEKQKTEAERKRQEQIQQQVASLLEQAQTAYTAGRLDDALELLGRALNLDPDNAQAIASKKAVTKEIAKQEAEKKRKEKEAEEQRRMKAERERKQREAEALRKKQEAERKRQEQVQQQVASLLEQAQTAYSAGRLKQALELLGRALNLDPENAQAITSKKAVTKEVVKQEAEKKRKEKEAEEQRRMKAERERKRREAEEEQKRKEQEHLKKLAGEFEFVQGGTFMMGSEDGIDDEKPVHEVELDDFFIGKYPVTQAQWKAVMGSNPSHFKGDERPVESVSWEDAQAFIRKLNELTGKTFRLPTEAEWEYAARGGQKTRGYTYAGSDNLHDVAWFSWNSGKQTHPVGRKRPNELGIYDMSGNVWEWCSDWYDDRYYEKSPLRNPQGQTIGDGRIFRGGDWDSSSHSCRCTYRFWLAGFRIIRHGFRLACSFR